MAAWGLGLVAVVGAAVAGGLGGAGGAGGVTVAEPSPAGSQAANGAVAVPLDRSIHQPFSMIVLDSPAKPNQVITTRVLVVRGQVQPGTGRIQVLLQSPSAAPIVVATVRPTILSDGRRRVRQPQFVVTLALPDPRPSGPAVVQIVAYDVSGRASDVLLRPIQIGAVNDPIHGGGPWDPPTGEDGLMGGITSGTNFSWMQDGE